MRLCLIVDLGGWQDLAVFLPMSIVAAVIWALGDTSYAPVCIIGMACVLNKRLLFGVVGAIVAKDVCEHLQGQPSEIKENLRAGWTNSAVVSALFLTICLPMTQADVPEDTSEDTEFVYRACSVIATGLALMGLLQACFALTYTDHLVAMDAVRFMVCYPWSVGNPICCTASSFAWALVAQCTWLYTALGMRAVVISGCVAVWTLWNFFATVRCYSTWTPSTPVPFYIKKWAFYRKMRDAGHISDAPEPTASVRIVPGSGADAPSPIVLDEPVKAALQRAAVDPEKLRQYAEDVALHPFLDKVLQEAGVGDIGTRLKTIEALSGAEATPGDTASVRIGRKVSADT